MPRPRFARLASERQEAILDVAAAEFGEHGFSRASYNRIIERAGLSKGAMYYYFADKQDLYATVVQDAVDRLFEALEPMREVHEPEGFWVEVERMSGLAWSHAIAEPRVAALMPALLNPRTALEGGEAMQGIHDRAAVWLQGVLKRGRAVGAVRGDLPDDLLLGVTLAVGETIDRWVAQRWLAERDQASPADPPSPQMTALLVDLLRRVAAPG